VPPNEDRPSDQEGRPTNQDTVDTSISLADEDLEAAKLLGYAPLTDVEVAELGYIPTELGWAPRPGRHRPQPAPTLEETLANIVEAPTELPEALAELEAIQAAARAILESDDDQEHKTGAMRALFETAEVCQLPNWARDAIERTIDQFFDQDEGPPARASWETETRRLRRLGYSACPVCCIDLPTDDEIDRLEAARREWFATEARRSS
jgi:hypothetical protein